MKDFFKTILFFFEIIVLVLVLIDISSEGAIKLVILYLGFKEIVKVI
jgi:hypothetical protein